MNVICQIGEAEICNEWKRICDFLLHGRNEDLIINNDHPKDCRAAIRAVLYKWLQISLDANWNELEDALINAKLFNAAKKLRDEHLINGI